MTRDEVLSKCLREALDGITLMHIPQRRLNFSNS
jgi:hypothetical protein